MNEYTEFTHDGPVTAAITLADGSVTVTAHELDTVLVEVKPAQRRHLSRRVMRGQQLHAGVHQGESGDRGEHGQHAAQVRSHGGGFNRECAAV